VESVENGGAASSTARISCSFCYAAACPDDADRPLVRHSRVRHAGTAGMRPGLRPNLSMCRCLRQIDADLICKPRSAPGLQSQVVVLLGVRERRIGIRPNAHPNKKTAGNQNDPRNSATRIGTRNARNRRSRSKRQVPAGRNFQRINTIITKYPTADNN